MRFIHFFPFPNQLRWTKHSVAGVVMFGSGRPQAGILIETPRTLQIDVQNIGQLAELRNKIWYVKSSFDA